MVPPRVACIRPLGSGWITALRAVAHGRASARTRLARDREVARSGRSPRFVERVPVQLRTVAAALAAAAVAVLATGCNLVTPQATTIEYDASDGISGRTGDVQVHNALLIGEEDGDTRSLAVTFTNHGEATYVQVRVADDTQDIRVPSGQTVYGVDEQLTVPADDVQVGGLSNVSFQAEGAEPLGLRVQVMSAEFPGYEQYAPTAAPEPEPTDEAPATVDPTVPTSTPAP